MALYYQAASGDKKKKVYGLRSQSSFCYCTGNMNENKSTAGSFETQNQEELQNELTNVYRGLRHKII